jgi:hypothetical protein
MSARTIGHRLFTDGATRSVYEDERGQFIVEGGERIDGVWLVTTVQVVVGILGPGATSADPRRCPACGAAHWLKVAELPRSANAVVVGTAPAPDTS